MPADALESNDDWWQASLIQANQTALVANLGFANDADWFWFRTQAGVEYRFATSLIADPVNADTDIILFLFAPLQFEEVDAVARDGKIGGGGVRTLQWTAPDNGDYYLKIREARNRGDCRPYKLSFTGDSRLFLPMVMASLK